MKRSSNTFIFRSIAYTLAASWLIPILLLCLFEAMPRHYLPGDRFEKSQLHGTVQSVIESDEEEREHKESADAAPLYCISGVDFDYTRVTNRAKTGLLNVRADLQPPLFRLHCSLII
jgi:hypothetical protein